MSVDPEAPVVETPEVPDGSAAPEATPQPPQHDWEQRYKDTHTSWQQAQDTLSDPEKLLAYIEQNHRELLEEEEAPAPPEPEGEAVEPAQDPRVDKHDEWIQQQQAAAALDAFNTDLDGELGDEREIPKVGREWVYQQTMANGANQDALKAAVDRWFEETAPADPPKPKPKAHHQPAGGSAPTGVAPEDMTPQQRVAWMTSQMQAAEQ